MLIGLEFVAICVLNPLERLKRSIKKGKDGLAPHKIVRKMDKCLNMVRPRLQVRFLLWVIWILNICDTFIELVGSLLSLPLIKAKGVRCCGYMVLQDIKVSISSSKL